MANRTSLSLIAGALAALTSAQAAFACRAEVSLHSGVDWIRYDAEIVATDTDRRRGLQHREDLELDEGMLFVYEDEADRAFWMKDTPLSLDILYFDRDHALVSKHLSTEPFSETPLPSTEPAAAVFEMRAGLFEALGMDDDLRIHVTKIKQCPRWVAERFTAN